MPLNCKFVLEKQDTENIVYKHCPYTDFGHLCLHHSLATTTSGVMSAPMTNQVLMKNNNSIQK